MIVSGYKSITVKIRGLKILLFAGFSLLLFCMGCSTEKRISRGVKKVFASAPVLKHHYSGFALYDLASGHMLFEKNADQYFTPASNTKLFTFYASLKMLPDSIPSLRYVERGDSLIFWGTGDPSFLQSKLKGTRAAEFLKSAAKKLFYAPGRYTGDFYGSGWQWDDYNDYYQAEINELPLMDNLLHVKAEKGKITLLPALFKDCLGADSAAIGQTFGLVRDFNSNHFKYPLMVIPESYTQDVPYKVSLPLTLSLLSDTLHKPVGLASLKMPLDARTIFNLNRDTVLKEMMLPSDNFIAEQLLLVCANQLGEELNTHKAISHIEKTYLSALPDKPRWADGSGLSRYNLFTPRSVVKLLDMIYKELNNPEKLFNMIPAGGKSGTLKNAYPKTDKPFVFGKTGTLSGVHNQSGFIRTKKGKTFIFSFMNNNYVTSATEVRKEMVRIMTYIHEQF
ncbi:D-alanyl-D-alanine carboxypeptidase/D-alanyl-D-alanine-endopeptidase [Pedobacter africanus]|uniref:D-alanyl-D-alanine carboxypeptidase / D-alanyl-D-alanine-endopeptidase (Penicillin-binding protein 4) n=1 Tax=Pedobacter africanus TaxID=151894 RepID=A0A1W2B8Y4_9SPHI|nr:D-alanyl-D-alanine carboxypeptidase [Pedobacter africanus]SMC69389.1 D-alanyl-D-alanine carboxypeptidase / D-alanyl-D-alanine-endopeptidase (penicillin-binding protein 4) [Pedobacter africanus]